MSYVQWPPLPAFTSVIASSDVYLNVTTPLTVIGSGGGGVAPSAGPTLSVVGSPTSTSITITFDVASITGTAPISYSVDYQEVGGASIPLTLNAPVGTVYTGTASGLTPNTTYQFIGTSSNATGSVQGPLLSVPTAPVTPTPPGNIPPVEFTSAGVSSMSVYIDTAAVTGTLPIIYTAKYTSTSGVSSANFFDQQANFVLSTGTTIQTCTVEQGPTRDISPSTVYYWGLIAANGVAQVSTIAPFPAYSTLAAPGPVGPLAPAPPIINSVSTTVANFSFTVPAQTTPAPGPEYSIFVAPTPTNVEANAVFDSFYAATLLASTFTVEGGPFSPSTIYYAMSKASQLISSVNFQISSSVTAFSTLAASPPPLAPSAPQLSTATTNSLSFVFSTPTQTTPAPGPQYGYYGGPSPVDLVNTAIFAVNSGGPTLLPSTFTGQNNITLSTNTTYYIMATAAQTIDGASYVISSPVTAMSTLAGPPPPAPTNVSTLIGVGFISYNTGGYSGVLLDTSQNIDVGNWQTDGVITYQGAEPSPNGVQVFSTLQGTGNKLILSLGGASGSAPVLSTMFGNPTSYDQGAIDLANSLCYAYFKGPGALNPLNYVSTAWAGFGFDGLDLDIEAATPSTTTLKIFASTLKANPGFANKIITAAPQTPYLTQGATSGLNANGEFTSFSAMNPATVLNEAYTGNAGNQESLLSPTSGSLIDYHFLQVYNNDSYSYPTGANSGNWNNVVAAWGIQSLQSGYPAQHPKNIYAFATTDGTPIFNESTDANAFNASLVTANSTIRAFSTTAGVLPYSSITIADWCAGIGFWAANTNVVGGTSSSLPVLSTMYGQPSTLNNMPTDVTMTYGGVFNSDSWGFIGGTNVPIPNARGY